jgi:hypothetical protein
VTRKVSRGESANILYGASKTGPSYRQNFDPVLLYRYLTIKDLLSAP